MIRPTLRLMQLKRANTIGFIGLGAMGRGMAANLLNKSFPPSSSLVKDSEKPAFVVYDAFPSAVDTFLNAHVNSHSGRDVIPASSPAGVARLAGTVFTMLPSSPEVKEVYLGENGLRDGLEALDDAARRETLFVDSTTLEQEVGKDVATTMRELGAEMVDAPVSGGVIGAEEATLSFMVGGSQEAFDRAQKYLQHMGRRSVHCGQSGNGLAAKICNNLLLGISMAGTAEAMLLGQSLGLSPELLASILNTSTGKCWSSEINNPAPGALPGKRTPAERDYQGGFLSRLMAKGFSRWYTERLAARQLMYRPLADLNLAIAAGKTSTTPLPVGQLTSTLYNTLSKHEEFAGRDFSVIFEYLRVAQAGGLKKT